MIIGDPFGKEESKYNGRVVAPTVGNMPVSINKNFIGKWVTKVISTDTDKIREYFKGTNTMMEVPADVEDTTFPLLPPVPTRLALFCMKGRVTYARLADKIEQYKKLEDNHPGIKALLKSLKQHCFVACQMKNNKAVLQVTVTLVFNAPKMLKAFINLRRGTATLDNTLATTRSTSGRNKRVAFTEFDYYKQGLKEGGQVISPKAIRRSASRNQATESSS